MNDEQEDEDETRDEQRILITQAMPGMVLARPVILPNRITLCGPGAALDEGLIKRLIIRGIKRIYVQGHPLPAPSQAPLKERLLQLEKRFSRVRDIPLMKNIENSIREALGRQP